AAGLAREGMAPLAGCTPEGLARELIAHASTWNFLSKAEALKTRPVLVVTSDDGLAPANDSLVAALKTAGDTHVTATHFAADHSYSDMRTELSAAVLKWLSGLSGAAR